MIALTLYELGETAQRTLDVLARHVGDGLSIRELAREAARLHGKGFYANTYREVRRMEGAGLLRVPRTGRESSVRLEPENPRLSGHLAQLELWRRNQILGRRPDAARALHAIQASLLDEPGLDAALLLEAARGVRLNRLDVLLLHHGARPEGARTREVAQHLGFASDLLILPSSVYVDMLAASAETPLRSLAQEGVAILGGERYWLRILESLRRGRQIRLHDAPLERDEATIAANLSRYGYSEFGSRSEPARELAVEGLVIHILEQRNARRRRVLGDLLAKNPFEPDFLSFLARRSGLESRLAAAVRGTRSPEVRRLARMLGKSLEDSRDA